MECPLLLIERWSKSVSTSTLHSGGYSVRSKTISFKLTAVMVVVATTMLMAATPVAAQQEMVLHSFGNGTDGVSPSGLISDATGNLFGTTTNGGLYEGQVLYAGTAFELSPLKGGGWSEKILHNFGNGNDGEAPSGLISDAAGNLYGTTSFGGGSICSNADVAPGGCGIVFELRPPTTKGKAWTEVVLYRFTGGKDGNNPNGVLTIDSSGNLYGTTYSGGGGFSNGGTVFELSPSAVGYWTVRVLHSFNGNGTGGSHPSSGLTFDASGNLYGTTCAGGAYQSGIVFELSPQNGGSWAEKILHDFNSNGTDGVCPGGGLTSDSTGNLYGTTVSGGNHNGTVFELTPSAGGVWTEQVLYKFNGGSGDGSTPYTGVLFDASGDLYGATTYGGTYRRGTVFKLTPTGGSWTESVMLNFGSGTDGQNPVGNLLMDGSGNLFGLTQSGGAYDGLFGSGTVFEIKP
jgi:uncharacterized repeat protein (TIGR03803 family)